MSASQPSSGRAMRLALVWGGANFFVNQAGAFVIFLVMARTLPVDTFGVFALAVVFVDALALQGKGALMDALMIRGEWSRAALSTAMWLAAAVVTIFIACATLGAPVLAELFNAAAFAQVFPALALTLVVLPMVCVMEAQLTARLELRTLALRSMAMVVAGGVVGVAVAFSPYPEWALVAQRAAQGAGALSLLWLSTRFVPQLTLDRAAMSQLALQAGALWRNQLLAATPWRMFEALVGAILGAASLGVLRVVARLTEVVQTPLLSPLVGILVPVLSRFRGEVEDVRRESLKVMGIGAFLLFPAFTGLALTAPELVGLLLGDVYAPRWPILTAVALMGLGAPLVAFRNQILATLRCNNLVTGLTVFEIGITLIVVLSTIRMGLEAVVFAGVGSSAFLVTVSTGFLLHRLKASPLDLLRAIGPAASGTLALAVAVLAIRATLDGVSDAVRLAVMAMTGVGVYFAALWWFYRGWLMAVATTLRSRE